MTRVRLLALWVTVIAVQVPLLLAMLCPALFGSTDRAQSMAVAQDECGNALFGGPPEQTISAHVGNGVVEGRRWAKIVAPIIDFFFGKGHCAANATEKPTP
jgi:hypothetical protein